MRHEAPEEQLDAPSLESDPLLDRQDSTKSQNSAKGKNILKYKKLCLYLLSVFAPHLDATISTINSQNDDLIVEEVIEPSTAPVQSSSPSGELIHRQPSFIS